MLDALTDFILKPAPHFAAGVVLFGAVWAFFKGVESVLADDTKLEIAVWLLGVKSLGPKMQPWPETFANVFDRALGILPFSLNGVLRSIAFSCMATSCAALAATITVGLKVPLLKVIMIAIFINAPIDCVSYLKTRYAVAVLRHLRSTITSIGVLIVDFGLTLVLTSFAGMIVQIIYDLRHGVDGNGLPRLSFQVLELVLGDAVRSIWINVAQGWITRYLCLYPAFVASIWVWLYAGAGLLLRAAHRFDMGFDWFNRTFDIEKHPLSSIGLVAGALVAAVYWLVVLVEWGVHRHG